MALIVLASASGSPGVSTTALGLTLNWHRPVLLVDADPTGSSAVFAGYFHGTQEPTGGLINLALALREGTLAAALASRDAVAGPRGPGRAGALVPARHPRPRAGPEPAAAVGAARRAAARTGPQRPGRHRRRRPTRPRGLAAAAHRCLRPDPAGHPQLAARAGRCTLVGQDAARPVRRRRWPLATRASSSSTRTDAGPRCPRAFRGCVPTPRATSPRRSRSPSSPRWTGSPRPPRSTPTAPASPASSSPPACCAATGPAAASIHSVLAANQAALAPTIGGRA